MHSSVTIGGPNNYCSMAIQSTGLTVHLADLLESLLRFSLVSNLSPIWMHLYTLIWILDMRLSRTSTLVTSPQRV